VTGASTSTSRAFGGIGAADYRLSPDTPVGFALAGGGTSFAVVNGGSGRSDLFQAAAFAHHEFGAAYLSGALAYGWQDVTTDRTATVAGVDRLQGRFRANTLAGRVEGGYRVVTRWMILTPYAAGQVTAFRLPAYAESVLSGANTFALNYGAKTVTASRSELGLRTDRSWAIAGAILTLRGCAAWAHDFNPDRTVAATFQNLPGASFIVNGAAQAPNAALTSASAEMKWQSGSSQRRSTANFRKRRAPTPAKAWCAGSGEAAFISRVFRSVRPLAFISPALAPAGRKAEQLIGWRGQSVCSVRTVSLQSPGLMPRA
jgi:uncharacterized protein with beta-barrel porin domain